MTEIQKNIKIVEKRITEACERAGRSRDEVKLIAVSKTMLVETILEAVKENIFVFGENKVQELVKKSEDLKDYDIEWHMIGHLQANKVKYLPNIATLIHSVDNLRLAGEIQKIGEKSNKILDILVQVNIAKENTKFGLLTEKVEDFVREVAGYQNIRVKGLMTVPPFVRNSEENRHYFKKMKKIMVDLNDKNIDNISMSVLSMGMTGDYEVAIEEGATLVRVGTGIFGERPYLK